MNNSYPMTPKGLSRLKEELERIKNVEIPKNIKDIEEAREHGDLSENAEYHAAKERQGHLAARRAYLEDRIVKANVLDPTKFTGTKIMFGATVTLENMDSGEVSTYQIVGEDESDPSNGMISLVSPIARVMIGKYEDDEFELKTPGGKREYLIKHVEYK